MIEYKYFISLRERDGEEKERKKRKERGCLIKEEQTGVVNGLTLGREEEDVKGK